MNHCVDLLSIQTPKHLRAGLENRKRLDCGDFEVNIFETFEPSTKVQIHHEGLSVSSMIRGRKTVYTEDGDAFEFTPGTSLILPKGKTIYADFPHAKDSNPVQCATILIPSETLETQINFLNKTYPRSTWGIDYSRLHIHNDSELVRAFNEILQLVSKSPANFPLTDLLLKSFLIRVIEAQSSHKKEVSNMPINSRVYVVKKYIKENIGNPISTQALTRIANCSKSTLYRLFENYCGQSPGEYILKERMMRSRNLLLDPDLNISDVAYQTGFTSVSYFVKQFKTFHNCTPGDFIRKFEIS